MQYLERRGFYPVSLSDVIREELSRDGLEATRENMIARGHDLRWLRSARDAGAQGGAGCERR